MSAFPRPLGRMPWTRRARCMLGATRQRASAHGAAQGETGQDRRYFYHQDRNWNAIALTEYNDGVGTDGRIAERYAYTPYGEFVVLTGDAGSGELGNVRLCSAVGNPFAHQGLPLDAEKGSYQNRYREYAARVQRFAQRDPVGYREMANAYPYARESPVAVPDPSGEWSPPLTAYGTSVLPPSVGKVIKALGGGAGIFVTFWALWEGYEHIKGAEKFTNDSLCPTMVTVIIANYGNEDSSQDSKPPCWGRIPVTAKGLCDFACGTDYTVNPPREFIHVFNCTGDAGYNVFCYDVDGRILDYCSRCYGIWSLF